MLAGGRSKGRTLTLNSDDIDLDPGTDDSGAVKYDVSRNEAEAAVRKLIQWAGDDPNREGLLDTPKRVTKAFEEFFSGILFSFLEVEHHT